MAVHALQGIAKLSGSFAVGGLIARELQGDPEDGALSILAGVLCPTTAHALSIRWNSSNSQPQAPRLRPFFALDSAGRATKVYPAEMRLRSVSSQFSPTSLIPAIARGLVFTYLPLVDAHYRKVKEAEDQALEKGEEFDYTEGPEFDFDAVYERGPAAALAIFKEVLVGITRVLLSWLAVDKLESRLAWKLVKDQISSIRAKSRIVFYQRPYFVFRTMIRTSVIPVLAEFTISSALITFRVLREDRPKGDKQALLFQTLTFLPLRQLMIMVASAGGAGISGAIKPGILCTIAALASGFAMDIFVCQPADEVYCRTGRINLQTKLIITGCAISVGLCFLPWLRLPDSISQMLPQDQKLALA